MKIEYVTMFLLAVSTATGLITEGLKLIFKEWSIPYKPNTLAGFVSVLVALWLSTSCATVTGEPFTAQTVVYTIALSVLSWLCAMLGYDKVMQTISQMKGDKDNG